MRKIIAFNFLTINGFYKGVNDDSSWHVHAEEGNKYSENKLSADNILVFGRKTYELMAGYWPSPMAYEGYPLVAKRMNESEKIVLSQTLNTADWHNTRILSGNTMDQIRQLKATSGKNIAILGSGSIINQLTDEHLIDEYEFLIDPLAIGQGTPLFENIKNKLELKLMNSQIFEKSGQVVLKYQRVN